MSFTVADIYKAIHAKLVRRCKTEYTALRKAQKDDKELLQLLGDDYCPVSKKLIANLECSIQPRIRRGKQYLFNQTPKNEILSCEPDQICSSSNMNKKIKPNPSNEVVHQVIKTESDEEEISSSSEDDIMSNSGSSSSSASSKRSNDDDSDTTNSNPSSDDEHNNERADFD
jgi:hypothetical protein